MTREEALQEVFKNTHETEKAFQLYYDLIRYLRETKQKMYIPETDEIKWKT